MPPKNLFASSSDDDEVAAPAVESLKVNRAYAEKFDAVKRKQELQKLSAKYADVEETDSEDTEEDDDAMLITDSHEMEFAELIRRIRSGDDSLKDTSVRFFANAPTDEEIAQRKTAAQKKFLLKDEFSRAVVAAASGDIADNAVDEDATRRGLKRAQTKEERAARAAFLEAAANADADAVADFTIKAAPRGAAATAEDEPAGNKKTKTPADKVKKAFKAGGEPVDPEETFLMNFFGSEVWRDNGKGDNYTWDQQVADDQDEIFYDDAELWEREYQDQKYRHEEGVEATAIQTFPRQQEGLLREKDTRRKEARERKEERVVEQTTKATEELKRLKALKREEIVAFQRKIADIAGFSDKKWKGKKGKPSEADLEDPEEDARVAALLSQAALEDDFDPETFDKQMGALFNDDYYNAIDEDEVAALEAEDTDVLQSDDSDQEGEQAAAAPSKKVKTTRQALKEDGIPESLLSEVDLLYPTQSITAAVSNSTAKKQPGGGLTSDELEKELEQKMDEYWKLHYHSVAGGVRTRFRYRDVNPERFGFDDEDVLLMDDRTLNMIAPFNSYASYLNKQQNTKDRYKALHRRKNLRTLNPERKSRRYKTNTTVVDVEAVSEEEGRRIATAARRLNKGTAEDVDALIANAERADVERNTNLAEKQAAKQSERPPRTADGAQRRPKPFAPQERPAQRGHFAERPNRPEGGKPNPQQGQNRGFSSKGPHGGAPRH